MRYISLVLVCLAFVAPVESQHRDATDVLHGDIADFIDALPRDQVSDRPIRVADVGGYRVGVYGVFRPKEFLGGANLHRVQTTEIYYILSGAGTLITGGELTDSVAAPNNPTSLRGSGIDGGSQRRIVAGDVVVIPGFTAHWWSEIEQDIEYLIFRPDPENRLPLK